MDNLVSSRQIKLGQMKQCESGLNIYRDVYCYSDNSDKWNSKFTVVYFSFPRYSCGIYLSDPLITDVGLAGPMPPFPKSVV